MVDLVLSRPGASLIGDVLWQSTLFLLIGLAVERSSSPPASTSPRRIAPGDPWLIVRASV